MSPKWTRGGDRGAGQPGVIRDVRPFELHGTKYYAVLFSLDAKPDAAGEARVSWDMVYDAPQPGDRIAVDMVLGVIDRIRKAE